MQVGFQIVPTLPIGQVITYPLYSSQVQNLVPKISKHERNVYLIEWPELMRRQISLALILNRIASRCSKTLRTTDKEKGIHFLFLLPFDFYFIIRREHNTCGREGSVWRGRSRRRRERAQPIESQLQLWWIASASCTLAQPFLPLCWKAWSFGEDYITRNWWKSNNRPYNFGSNWIWKPMQCLSLILSCHECQKSKKI